MSIQGAEYHRKYHAEHIEKWREYNKRDYAKRREKIRLKRKSPAFKKKLSEYLKGWRARNVEKRRQAMRDWMKKNPERARELHRASHKRLRQDPIYVLKERLRIGIGDAVRRGGHTKSGRTLKLLGCSIAEVKRHIESQFVNGMSWARRREWDIDHIVPLSAFDMSNAEEQLCAFNWKNLRPLPYSENRAKKDKLPSPLPSWLPAPIAQRILARQIKHPLTTG